jgi:hypothetical protein
MRSLVRGLEDGELVGERQRLLGDHADAGAPNEERFPAHRPPPGPSLDAPAGGGASRPWAVQFRGELSAQSGVTPNHPRRARPAMLTG